MQFWSHSWWFPYLCYRKKLLAGWQANWRQILTLNRLSTGCRHLTHTSSMPGQRPSCFGGTDEWLVGLSAHMSWWDRFLNTSGDCVEVWCVSSATQVPCIYIRVTIKFLASDCFYLIPEAPVCYLCAFLIRPVSSERLREVKRMYVIMFSLLQRL